MDEFSFPTHTFVLRNHIGADILETYLLGEIAPAEADLIDEHLSVCEECRHFVTQAEWAVALAATVGIRTSGLLAVHATADGPVVLSVRREGNSWLARVRSPFGTGEATMAEADAARAWCGDTFRSQYPDHTCAAACRYHSGRCEK